jgi:hypothetical protein
MGDKTNIKVDFSKRKGIPLFKKFALFNSGIAPIKNYKRDMYTLDGVYVESLRADLFFGNKEHPLGLTVTGTQDDVKYDFSVLDEWMDILSGHGIVPYMSWCYIPIPLQVEGDWRKGPSSLKVWQEIYCEYAKHCKEKGINVYHEIYNEPDMDDVFFDGTWQEYLQMYKYGAKGVLEGDPDAVIGGPSTAIIERQKDLDDFLTMVEKEDLPLDFFSYHSYPQNKTYTETGYIWRGEMASKALAKNHRFDTTELHMNELNLIPVPWLVGGPLDKTLTAMLLVQSFKDLLEQTDLTLVHWAQWLSSTVDGLGMVEDDGKIKTSMHAYRMYGEMPLGRVMTEVENKTEAMASADSNKACILIWNKEDICKEVNLALNEIPFEKGKMEIYKLDDEIYPYPEYSEFDLSTVKVIEEAYLHSMELDLPIGKHGIAFVRITNALESESKNLPDAKVTRKHHYYPRRGVTSYAEFNHPDWSAWLGMGDEDKARCIVGVSIKEADEKYKCKLEIYGEPKSGESTYLGIRVDYRVNGEYVKSLEYSALGDEKTVRNIPWGSKRKADIVLDVNMNEWEIQIAGNAPEGWAGEAIITFDMQDMGKGTQTIFRISK